MYGPKLSIKSNNLVYKFLASDGRLGNLRSFRLISCNTNFWKSSLQVKSGLSAVNSSILVRSTAETKTGRSTAPYLMEKYNYKTGFLH